MTTSLVTVARYRMWTGDSSHAVDADEDRLLLAEEELAEALDRPLTVAERTERLYPTRDGRLWPRAVPITVLPAGYARDGLSIRSSGPFVPVPNMFTGVDYIEVTYTGGWLERTAADTDALNRLPIYMERDLAWAAYWIGHPDHTYDTLPTDAKSVSLGDAAVTFGDDGPPRPGSTDGWWSEKTLAWRYRVIGTPLAPRGVLL